jgi:signal transduction histidine kinase
MSFSWMPERLYPRVVLLLFFGMLSVFIITFAILANERTQAFFLAQQSPQLNRIERLLSGFESSAPRQRRNMANRFDAPNFRIELGEVRNTGMWGAEIASGQKEVQRFTDAFEGVGRNYAWQIRRYKSDSDDSQPVRVYASTTLMDNTPVSFNYPFPSPPVSLSRAYLALGLAFTLAILIALILARILLRPLTQLAEHSNALSRSLAAPMLPEAGPTEVKAAAKAMNQMQKKLLALDEQRKQMLSAVSHDLKTPITRMLLRTEFMEDRTLTEKFIKDLKEMEGMINETLDFIKTQAQNEKAEPTDIVALLQEAAAEFSEMGHSVQVTSDAQEPHAMGVFVPVRRKLLKRCITNLLNNGIKYGKALECKVQANTDFIVIKFTDQGPGIPEDQLSKVFDPFYRTDVSRNKNTGGHGLGLTICRQIAVAHGGDIWLENNPHGGLTANLRLPR